MPHSIPQPTTTYPLANYPRLAFLKNIITRPTIEVGDYTYYDDFENVHNFERNVKYHFDFVGDKLIIGKFCMIASGASFIMNGANHLSSAVSAYPFAIFGEAWQGAMAGKAYPNKGDTIIGNDVWLGHNCTIMPGVKVGDGAIVAANATVVKDVAPYTLVGGNPATEIRKRFTEEQIKKLLALQWWNWPIEKITRNLPLLTSANVDALLKAEG